MLLHEAFLVGTKDSICDNPYISSVISHHLSLSRKSKIDDQTVTGGDLIRLHFVFNSQSIIWKVKDTYSSRPELSRPESSRHESRSEFEEEPIEVAREDRYTEYTRSLCKKKKTSKVWSEFKQIRNEHGEGTSHLKRHLLDSCPKRPHGPLGGWKEILLFVVDGDHPFAKVKENGFRRMMRKANPLFQPFSITTLTRDLFSMYFEERERLKALLKSLAGRIYLTTDNWKSKHSWQNYICIMAHFVDHNWKLHKKILRFRSLSPPYTGESIFEEILIFLCQWNMGVSVDNAIYNDSMMNRLKIRLNSRGMLNIMEKIRSLLQMILKSTSKSKEFYELVQRNFHLDDKRKINLDM
ncbi:zinc finger BED domain-containing protein RICESLEEPER 3-like [Amaranthus tricolor]|uniref:zinc finger BED domain-containing protein RICESLEEPER 3-like n=1 Tax=Amaranthus tricolor TaxID=29722 RepID=UPI002589EF55|nr:zinc finger BED domain-containing protein RICESLEEPER 3-like [Amaranthus tricolor]